MACLAYSGPTHATERAMGVGFMEIRTCSGCRYHYQEWYCGIFQIDFCRRTGHVVGYECPEAMVENGGCSRYERILVWPKGAIP